MAMVSSWMMMELLIYGWTPRANTVACAKAPPDITLYRPSTVVLMPSR